MSVFGDQFAVPMEKLLGQLGDAATYTAEDGSTAAVTVIFNEYVGAVDDQARALFTISTRAANGITSPKEGDWFQLDGETDVWTVVDVRDSKDDTAELRCDRSKLVH